MKRLISHLRTSLTFLAVVFGVAGRSDAGLVFNFNPAAGTSQQAVDGFTAAGARWSNIFNDDITVNINIGFTSLGGGILAQAGSSTGFVAYTDVRDAMIADITSADDVAGTNNLRADRVHMIINGLFGNPGQLLLDNNNNNNNNFLNINSANAKALGLLAGNDPIIDAQIAFNSNFAFDFDGSDGISAGAFDFVGIAAHEIGHALGFVSGVDILDANFGQGFGDNDFPFVTTLDLFRYSAEFLGQVGPGVIDWSVDRRDKFFSLDGGVTKIASFSNGVNFGDGNQASHWKDDLGLGIMDPTSGFGELLSISSNDVRAFDVIGYDLRPRQSAVPEPATLAMGGLATLATLAFVRRRSA